MTISAARQKFATAVTTALSSSGIVVHPYQRDTVQPLVGWTEVERVDEEGVPFGCVHLVMNLAILVASTRRDFEKVQDALSVPLISAIVKADGRSPVVQPYTDVIRGTTFYALQVQFHTETEA